MSGYVAVKLMKKYRKGSSNKTLKKKWKYFVTVLQDMEQLRTIAKLGLNISTEGVYITSNLRLEREYFAWYIFNKIHAS